MKKPEITYPCTWNYKLIGTDENLLKQGIYSILSNRDYKGKTDLSVSRKSRTGKYVTVNLTLLVDSEKTRLNYFEALKKIESLKIII